MKKLAVIGAGLSGLTVASELKDIYDITVFEKSRGGGGRMATRKAGDYAFDHGAQYFTANDDRFKLFLDKMMANNLVTPWQDEVTLLSGADNKSSPSSHTSTSEKYISSPTMTALCKAMTESLDVHIEVHISSVSYSVGQWFLTDQNETTYGPFEILVSSMPHGQFLDLLTDYILPDDALTNVKMTGCFSLMIGDTKQTLPDFSAARVIDSPIGWIAVNSKKPGRNNPASIIVQSTNEWAEQNFEIDKTVIQNMLLSELAWLTKRDYAEADHVSLHRWRYAFVEKAYNAPFYSHPNLPLHACGDWCLGPRVESAYLSGLELAEVLKVQSNETD